MSRSFRDAIYEQPANLEAAAAAFREAEDQVDLSALCEGTLVLSGIGASAHALIPAVLALRAAGRRAFAVSSGELGSSSAAQLGDAFVLVSQSGAGAETVTALGCIGRAPVVAISARGESPLASAADVWLPLGPAPDTPVATLSYTASLQALGMLCDTLLGRGLDAWSRLPELASQVLQKADARTAELAEPFASIDALDAVGGGSAHASAGESALLGREALRLPSTGMETREYLHGPLEAVEPSFGCILFGAERERELANQLASFGARVALIGPGPAGGGTGLVGPGPAEGAAATIDLPPVEDLAAPILQILPVQLLVDQVARRRGLEVGSLRRQQHDTKVA
jgi:glutamine---fructose-6-phosphate transaminase (isomerizing)